MEHRGRHRGHPDDKIFIRWRVDWVKDTYNVDAGRIYATGQSSGGAMSHATAYYMSDIFTAAAPVSAMGANMSAGEDESKMTAQPVAVMCCVGTGDPYFKAEGFGSESAGFGGGKALIEHWTNKYHTVQKWEDFTYMNDEAVCSYQTGIFRNYVFRTAEGVPMLRCVEVVGKVHAYLPSEAYMIWDEFFSAYHKDADGNLYYMNTPVKLD